tara:strand:- start:1261 stop:1683 length:423 start_codon:yes stop_codon:yes gene_type:complete
MGTSWNKRHATTITGRNGDSIDRGEGQRRYWERYEEWKKGCMEGPPGRRKWKKMPLKWGDVWNPRLECWWSEIRIGHRYPEGHDQQGELTPKGELAAGIKKQEWKPNKTMPVNEKPSTLTAVTTTKWKRLSHREAIGEEE